ncbi:MAG: hypothetical protein IPI01_19145 [Ignavibacteriae bacterium]|nr:hypothetical protein [Ignavibacteriota bacterium]
MKHRTALFLVCALCCAALTSQAMAGGPYTLRFGLQQGKTYLYADVVHADVTQEMMGQEMKSATISTSLSRLVIEKSGADGISAITSLDSMTVSVKNARMDTTMVMPDLLGKRSRIVLSPLGRVLSKAVIDTVGKAGSPMRGASARDAMRVHVFPEAPVAAGGTWTGVIADTNEAMGGKIVTVSTLTYTLAGEEQKAGRACVKITYAGTMAVEGKGSMMGAEIFTEGKGTVSGVLHFDAAAGVTVADESRMETDMTAAITGAQNMTMPISTVGSSTRTLRAVLDTAH